MFQIGSDYICIIKLFYRKLWFQFRYMFMVHYCSLFRVPKKFTGKWRIIPGYWEILTHYSPDCLLSTQILEKILQADNLKRKHRLLRTAWLSCEKILNLQQALLEISKILHRDSQILPKICPASPEDHQNPCFRLVGKLRQGLVHVQWQTRQ